MQEDTLAVMVLPVKVRKCSSQVLVAAAAAEFVAGRELVASSEVLRLLEAGRGWVVPEKSRGASSEL